MQPTGLFSLMWLLTQFGSLWNEDLGFSMAVSGCALFLEAVAVLWASRRVAVLVTEPVLP